jgi:DtxR family Mn-dependent transcriptional regulator
MIELTNLAEEFLDEILEILWVELEEGGKESVTLDEIVVGSVPVLQEPITVLKNKGLVKVDGDQIQLTDSGFEEARRTIRRHRLSERMFLDIFEIKEDEIEEVACRFEHMLIRPELEEKICELLGHPRSCPHDRAIPIGDCCHRAQTRVDQMVVPMSNLRQGESGAIAYVQTGDSERLKKLMALGILPGESVTLQRRYPSFVFTVGQSRYAVDEGMAAAIYVKRVVPEEGQGA